MGKNHRIKYKSHHCKYSKYIKTVCIVKMLTKIFNTKLEMPIVERHLGAQIVKICFKKNIFDLVKNNKKYLAASINIIKFYTHEILLSQNNTILFAEKMNKTKYFRLRQYDTLLMPSECSECSLNAPIPQCSQSVLEVNLGQKDED